MDYQDYNTWIIKIIHETLRIPLKNHKFKYHITIRNINKIFLQYINLEIIERNYECIRVSLRNRKIKLCN